MRKVFGVCIIISIFTGIFAFLVAKDGLLTALGIFGIASILVALIMLAQYLIWYDEDRK